MEIILKNSSSYQLHHLIFWMLISCTCANGQEANNPVHILGFETGMYNRGLSGVSYQRLFIQKKRLMLAAGAGSGIGGVPFGQGLNQFYYLTFSTGIGAQINRTQFYLSPGIDLKYLNFHDGVYDETTDSYLNMHYEGLGAMPYLGLTIIEEHFFIQMRAAPLFLMNGFKASKVIPGVGLTVGYLMR